MSTPSAAWPCRRSSAGGQCFHRIEAGAGGPRIERSADRCLAPEGSVPMTEVEDLRAQLKAALKSRAMVYSAMHDELSQEFGEAKAEEILKRAIYKRGAAICAKFAAFAPGDFTGLRDAFLDFI